MLPPRLADLPGIAAGFTTREGGVSVGANASLNLGLSTDDDPAAVSENRRRAARALGFEADDLAIAGQVHGSDAKVVGAPGLYRGFDALVTATPGVLLAMSAADCASVLLADPGARVVGAAHAGWRGTVGEVVRSAVETMQTLGAEPARLHAYVSPCISAENFEVGEEVAERFPEASVVRRADWPRAHADVKATLRAQLEALGVPTAQIEVDPACTFGDARFFSYRRDAGETGRMMGLIGLR